MTFRVEIPARRQIKGGTWAVGSFHAFSSTPENALASLQSGRAAANKGRPVSDPLIVYTGPPIVTEIDLPLIDAILSDPSPGGYWPTLTDSSGDDNGWTLL